MSDLFLATPRIRCGDVRMLRQCQSRHGSDFHVSKGEVIHDALMTDWISVPYTASGLHAPTGVRAKLIASRRFSDGYVKAMWWREWQDGYSEALSGWCFFKSPREYRAKLRDPFIEYYESQHGVAVFICSLVPAREEIRHMYGDLLKNVRQMGENATEQFLDRVNFDRRKAGLPTMPHLPVIPTAEDVPPEGVIVPGEGIDAA